MIAYTSFIEKGHLNTFLLKALEGHEKRREAMSQCQFIESCAFYNNRLNGIPNDGLFFKSLFCTKKPEKCARLKLSESNDVSDTRNMVNPLGIEYGTGIHA